MARQKSESKTIRFLRAWQGRSKGDLNSNLTPGIMQTLVDHGTAEWTQKRGNRNKNAEHKIRGNRRAYSGANDAE